MLKNFRYNITIRVFILLLLTVGVAVAIPLNNYFLLGIAALLLPFAVMSLIEYVNRTNKDLSSFLKAVQYNDFTTNNSTTLVGAHFEELHEGFNMINRKFLDIRAEKEANYQFLQALVQHINIGLLCTNQDGEVILFNEALQKLLRKSYLTQIKALKKIDPALWEALEQLEPGQKTLVKVNVQNNLLQLSVQSVEIILQKEPYRLISFQDIQTELEAQELIAWQKLIRILTHEIMNSVAPISSLSSTLKGMLTDQETIEGQQLEQIKQSLAVIERRSEGLLDFTETYRKLTKVPPPQFQVVHVPTLIQNVLTLLEIDLKQHGIDLKKQLQSEKLSLKGDPNLLEQVLINLLKNAIDAVSAVENPTIKIAAFHHAGRICIQVADNGCGIPKEKIEQIFVPFFTTKAHGSGVGLSLSRQIIRMHKGTIELKSEEQQGTVVSIYI